MNRLRRCSSDEESDPSTPKNSKTYRNERRKKHFAQHCRKAWESNPGLTKLIKEDKNSKIKAKCKICDACVTADTTALKNHAKCLSNIWKMQSAVVKQPLTSKFLSENIPHDSKVKSAEIILSSFLAEYSIRFNAVDHFSNVIKKR